MPSLEEVARVKIDPKTLDQVLSNKRKKELRKEVIKAYLKKKPYGKRTTSAQLKVIGNFATGNLAWIFIKRMVRDGELSQHSLGPRSFFFTVNEELKVTQPADPAKLAELEAKKNAEEEDRQRKAGTLIPEHLRAEAAKAGRGPDIEERSDVPEDQPAPIQQPVQQPVNGIAPGPAMYSLAHLEHLAMRCEFYKGRNVPANVFLQWIEEQNRGL